MKLSKPLLPALALLFVLLIHSCGTDDVKPKPRINDISPKVGVAGTIITLTGKKFSDNLEDYAITLNGVPATVLSATTTEIKIEAPEVAVKGSVPLEVKINGKKVPEETFRYLDIYILANEFIANPEGGTSNVKVQIWNDGFKPVTDGTSIKMGWGLAVNNDDVYVTGHKLEGGKLVPVYWKNNQEIPLAVEGEKAGSTQGIAVSNGNIYIIQNEWDPSIYKYWKNGVETFFTGVAAEEIEVAGNDVYIGGYRVNEYGKNEPVYLKNTERIYLSTESEKSISIVDIKVVGQDVYVLGSGSDGARPRYWKNGVVTLFGRADLEAGALNLFVSGEDVYVVGAELNASIPGLEGVIWKNGVEINRFHISPGPNFLGGIFVFDDDIVVCGNIGGNEKLFFAINGQMFILNDNTRYVNFIDFMVR